MADLTEMCCNFKEDIANLSSGQQPQDKVEEHLTRQRTTLHMILFCFLIAFQWSEDPLSSPIIFVESNRDGHFVLPNLTMDNPINSLSLRKAFNLSQNQTYHCQQIRMSVMTSILME